MKEPMFPLLCQCLVNHRCSVSAFLGFFDTKTFTKALSPDQHVNNSSADAPSSDQISNQICDSCWTRVSSRMSPPSGRRTSKCDTGSIQSPQTADDYDWSRYERTEFVRAGDADVNAAYARMGLAGEESAYDLCNPIHPIFARHNFPSADYDALVPALRLASLLISTDCLLDWWYYTLHPQGPSVEFPKDHVLEGGEYRPKILNKGKLSALQLASVKLDLLGMANIIRFYRCDFDSPTAGACTTRGEGTMIPAPGDRPFYGCPSAVCYNDDNYEVLCEISRDAKGTGSSFNYLELAEHLSFAEDLVHELAHAVENAVGVFCTDPVGLNKVAEAGFDCTSSIFGGIFSTRGSDWVEMSDWPDASVVLHYLSCGHRIHMVEAPTKGVSMRWIVPFTFVEQLFRMSFWQVEVPKRGADALKVRKQVGYRWTTDNCSCNVCTQKPWSLPVKEKKEFYDLVGELPDPECNRMPLPVSPLLGSVADASEGCPAGYMMLMDGTIVDPAYAETLDMRLMKQRHANVMIVVRESDQSTEDAAEAQTTQAAAKEGSQSAKGEVARKGRIMFG